MAPRASWKGRLTIGDLACSVALYAAATTTDRVTFHTINRKTGHRVRRRFIDSETGKPVESEDQTKGYELAEGDYITLSDDEIAAALPESDKTITVSAFVKAAEIDEIYFDKPYYLTPADKPSEEAFALIRDDRQPAKAATETWAMEFVHDQLVTGRNIRVLTIVDIFTRYSPVVDPRFSYRVENVVATLERICAQRGYPRTLRVDQGSEFISRDLDLWAYAKGVTLDFSRPGKPTDNAFIESFNGRFRAECLDAHWFMTLADAKEKMETWLSYDNTEQPHGAIGYKTPCGLANPGPASGPSPA